MTRQQKHLRILDWLSPEEFSETDVTRDFEWYSVCAGRQS